MFPVGVARCELAVLSARQPGKEATGSLLLLRHAVRVDTLTCLDGLATGQLDVRIDRHILAHDDVVFQRDEVADPAVLAERDVAASLEVLADHDTIFDSGVRTHVAGPADHDVVADRDVGVHADAALEHRVMTDLHPGKLGVKTDLGEIADDDLHELATVSDHDVVADVHVVLKPDVVPDGDVVTDGEAPPDLHLNDRAVRVYVRVGGYCIQDGCPQ